MTTNDNKNKQTTTNDNKNKQTTTNDNKTENFESPLISKVFNLSPFAYILDVFQCNESQKNIKV